MDRSQAPAVTPVTEPGDGSAAGDLAAILDADLASRIDEVMHRETVCEDGKNFDQEHAAPQKRAGGTLGEAICGAQAVASMAGPGGPFNDLLLLNTGQVPFGFADAAGNVAQAANVVSGFVLDYSPMLAISSELGGELSTYLMALAIDTIVNNIPLKGKNRIEASACHDFYQADGNSHIERLS